MIPFRLATFESTTGPRSGLIVGELIYDLAELTGRPAFSSVLKVLEEWATTEAVLQDVANETLQDRGKPIDSVQLLAPVHYPPAVYCAGANYADHVANMERKMGLPPGPDPRADGGRPFHFLKASRCCVGHNTTVRAPSEMLDWEAELVAVIGIEARKVSTSEALAHVAGYMVGNDLSARDLGFRRQLAPTSVFSHSFLDHKSFKDSAPVGPWLVPASAIADPANLHIRTVVNNSVKQDGNTSGMIFSLQEQIAYLSSVTPLYPGDIIMTGTPAGTGAESGEFLNPGDQVTVSIEGLGDLTTQIA